MTDAPETRVLTLDLSTSTGWALLTEGAALCGYGVIQVDTAQFKRALPYPSSYMHIARTVARRVETLWLQERPTVVVIEEVNLGRDRYAQKMLDFIHFAVCEFLESMNTKVVFVSSSDWRKKLEIKLSASDKKNNSLVLKAKKSGVSKKTLGVKGRVNKKHLAIRWVNERYQLSLKAKDDDIADAICLGAAYWSGVSPSNPIH